MLTSQVMPQPLLWAAAQIQHHVPALTFHLWDSLRYRRVRLLTFLSHTTSLLVSPGVSLEQSDPSFLTPNHSFLQQRQWEFSYLAGTWPSKQAQPFLQIRPASGVSLLDSLPVVPLGCPTWQGGGTEPHVLVLLSYSHKQCTVWCDGSPHSTLMVQFTCHHCKIASKPL